MTHVLFTDYEKATGETACIFLPYENTNTLYQLMANYKSRQSDTYQFNFTDKTYEVPPYKTDLDLQRERSKKLRLVWVNGTVELPEELLTTDTTNTTDQMITLLSNGGIMKYIRDMKCILE